MATLSLPEFELTLDEQQAVPLFYADLEVLDDPAVPYETKKWMFDTILKDMVPYRYHDGPRMFPDINFYMTLLYNRPNDEGVWGLVYRFHEWISMMATFHPEEADQAIAALELRAMSYGWPNTQAQETSPATSQMGQASTSPGQTIAPSPLVSSTPASLQAKRAKPSNMYETEHQHPILTAELVAAPTFRYKGVVQNMDHFEELDDAYERHVKRAAGKAPDEDASWPSSAEQQRAYVESLFGHVTDLGNFYELRKARERLAKLESQQGRHSSEAAETPSRKRRRGAGGQDASFDAAVRPKGISKTDWALTDAESAPVELLEAVIHYQISDVEIELLCWRLLRAAMEMQLGFTMRPLWSGSKTIAMWEHFDTFAERWQAISENVLDCKILIHSLTRADWICKYAGAPSKERGGKLNNDLLNGRRDIQNQVGRDVIKQKTLRQDWTTSEDFEIRNKEGELVLKAGHLGDKKRRQLAVRSQKDGES
ncbi:uncharacterized protein LY79DRAFT_590528 [Colletotrichum navitas]|uniref:Uncharacterized protein n=1 Tax=Colletotrichum navitas TaxID=681940 RepID=A0AAD8V4J3_9PEZI|nr:uncharacterized protein LY79DRAFT_590528 [Colletotrichum navitas]KAK1590326.1 hypothetical protein LY79DRAFT_590528 [Colletotrichum navitas]